MLGSAYWEERKKQRTLISNVKEIVYYLSEELGERTLRNYDNLQKARKYINEYFKAYGTEPKEETFKVDGIEVANVVAELKGVDKNASTVIVGAHYDTVEGSPGADDNASAVAGLLEIYRLLSGYRFRKNVRFVAFTLEEPPFFSTDLMGSMRHAKGCKKRKDDIELMVCLEMIGYGGKKHNQDFPGMIKKELIPDNGSFITVVTLPSRGEYAYRWAKIFNENSKQQIYEMVAPASVPGMDLSDHRSFLHYGFPAIMICDTGFYRNKNYHTEQDTYDTLNYSFLSDNIKDCFNTLREILDMDSFL